MNVIFLDRDGVINRYPGDTNYVTSVKEFYFISGSIEGIKKINEKGFKLFVISNQAGVTKGLYSQKELDAITGKMLQGFKKYGAHVDKVYYCIHQDIDNCLCRKPRIGLMQQAIKEFNLSPKTSFFIGDSFIDMQAAREFGAKSVLVLSGKEKITNRKNWKFEPEYIFDNLLVAAHYICTNYE